MFRTDNDGWVVQAIKAAGLLIALALGAAGLVGCGQAPTGSGQTSAVACLPAPGLDISQSDFAQAIGAADRQLDAFTWAGAAPSMCQIDEIIIVTEATANVPAPALTGGIRTVVQNGLTLNMSVRLVEADGAPNLVSFEQSTVAGQGDGRARRVSNNMNSLDSALAQARPRSNEMAVIEAVFVAAQQAVSDGKVHPLILVLGSSLDSTPAIGFISGAMGAEPTEVAAAVKQANPAVDLSGVSILFGGGVGYGVGSQQHLTDAQRVVLANALLAICSTFGASAAVDPGPASGSPVTTDFTVTPVVFDNPDPTVWNTSDPPSCKPTVQVYDATSDLRFQPRSDVWVYPTAARQTLAPVAAWLAADPTRHLDIEGRTMNVDTIESQRRTGLDRANATKNVLVSLGAGAQQISTSGVGSQFEGYYTPDFLPSGAEVPEAAAHNRNIQLTAYENC